MPPWDDAYRTWADARSAFLIACCGPQWFRERLVYDLGCGHGWVGEALIAKGAYVRFFDGNPDHVRALHERQRTATLWDADNEPVPDGADMLVCFGLLYHLATPRDVVRAMCGAARYLAIESEVVDSDDPEAEQGREEHGYDQSRNRYGVVPSTGGIEAALTAAGARWVRCDDARLNTTGRVYDWEATNDGSYTGRRRLWLVECVR